MAQDQTEPGLTELRGRCSPHLPLRPPAWESLASVASGRMEPDVPRLGPEPGDEIQCGLRKPGASIASAVISRICRPPSWRRPAALRSSCPGPDPDPRELGQRAACGLWDTSAYLKDRDARRLASGRRKKANVGALPSVASGLDSSNPPLMCLQIHTWPGQFLELFSQR